MAPEAVVLHGTSKHALFLLFIIPLVVLLLGRRWRRSKQQNQLLPPSPPFKLPVIGHLHLIGSSPHVSLRELARNHGRDLMLLRLGSVPTVIVSSPHAAEAVLRTHDQVLASRAPSAVVDIIFYRSSDISFAPYGEHWRQARKVVTTHMLNAKMVRSFRQHREEEVRISMAKIREAAASAARTAVDMSELLGSFANDVLSRAVLGKHHRHEGRNKLFRDLIEINVSLLGGFNLEDYFPSLAMADVLARIVCRKAKMVRKRWDDLFDKLIQEDEHAHHHREQGEGADFIHVLLSLQEQYGLTTDNVKAILMDVFGAGTETSYLVLEFAMAELMHNEHVMAKLQVEVRRCMPAVGNEGELYMVREDHLGDMSYLKATVKETLRLHPPAPLLLPHFSIAACEVDGYSIPSGTRVMVNAWALGRDPGSWERPEEFVPDRFLQGGSAEAVDGKGKDFAFVPFGSGRRICPGIDFASASIEVMLANLIYHFDWELPEEMKEIDMTEVFGLTLRRKEKLFLVPRFPGK